MCFKRKRKSNLKKKKKLKNIKKQTKNEMYECYANANPKKNQFW